MHNAGYKDKAKKPYHANYVTSWYHGNYLNSLNDTIREGPFKDDVLENWRPRWSDDTENTEGELKGKTVTHAYFLKLVKELGIHDKYYHYKKYENNCEVCKELLFR